MPYGIQLIRAQGSSLRATDRGARPSALLCSWYVIPRAGPHGADLLDQIVERFVAGVGVELRGFDDEERRRVVVKEEVMVGLVQFAEILIVRLKVNRFGVHAAA